MVTTTSASGEILNVKKNVTNNVNKIVLLGIKIKSP